MNEKASKFVRIILIIPFAIMMAQKSLNTFDALMLTQNPTFTSLLAYALIALSVSLSTVMFRFLRLGFRLLCGRLTGYRLGALQVWNFVWTREHDRFRFIRLPGRIKSIGCILFPPEMVNGRYPFFLCEVGGEILCMILAFVLILVSSAFSAAPIFSAVLFFVSCCFFMFALFNVIPMKTKTGRTSGHITLELSRDPRALRARWINFKLLEEYSRGVLMKDMPSEWFHVPTADEMENGILAHGGFLACRRMISEQKFEEASHTAEFLLHFDSIKGVQRIYLIDLRIYCELVGENRAEVLDTLLTEQHRKKAWGSKKPSDSSLIAQYAYALLHEQDSAKAEALNSAYEAQVKFTYFPGDVKDDLALLDHARHVAAERSNQLQAQND